MFFRFTLVCDGHAITLPDPAGGWFDAAGDFDRLLPIETELPINPPPELLTLDQVEAYADVEFTFADMAGLLRDAATLRPLGRAGPETRGLDRLKAMSEHALRNPEAVIRVEGY